MGATFAKDFKAAHPEELGADGKIRVCIGGGAGFIGSHIAKKLKEEVNNTNNFYFYYFKIHALSKGIKSVFIIYDRVAMLFVLIGKITNSCNHLNFVTNFTKLIFDC